MFSPFKLLISTKNVSYLTIARKYLVIENCNYQYRVQAILTRLISICIVLTTIFTSREITVNKHSRKTNRFNSLTFDTHHSSKSTRVNSLKRGYSVVLIFWIKDPDEFSAKKIFVWTYFFFFTCYKIIY